MTGTAAIAARRGAGDLARRAARRVGLSARRRLLSAFARLTSGSTRELAAHHNDFFFTELGITRRAAEAVLADASARSERTVRPDDSIHFLVFAALKAAGLQPTNVLELGTADGETTAYLAALFGTATVYSFELPDDDPILARYHGQGIDRAKLATRLACPNIRAQSLNTAFLARLDLPDFDLVWLDAGHEYPEVAWDYAYCLAKLRPGGWLLSDDIRPPDNRLFRGRKGAFDAWEVTDYFDAREGAPFRYLLKREDPFLYVLDRKYVGTFHKPAVAKIP